MEAIEVIKLHEGDIVHFSGLTKTDIGSYSLYRHDDDSLMVVDKDKEVIRDMARGMASRFSMYLVPEDFSEDVKAHLRKLH